MTQPSEHDLEAYLDEALPVEEMVRIEEALRKDPALLTSVASINSRRDAGLHSLGEIWRRHHLSCPEREQLGSYLLGAATPGHKNYLEFHLQVVGCRRCQANLDDLREQMTAKSEQATRTRRRRYFETSAGLLKPR